MAALCSVALVAFLGLTSSAAAQPPKVLEAWPGPVTSDTASITSRIEPRGLSGTYQVELGTSPCSAGLCATVASGAIAPLAAGAVETIVSRITGLAASTEYAYRVTAKNKTGQAVAAEGSFRTFGVAAQSALPDGRAYELVSGGLVEGADYGGGDKASGFAQRAPQRASLAGGGSTFTSFTASDPATGSPAAVQYLSTRTSTGWAAENIAVPALPLAQSSLVDPVKAFSPDLSLAAVTVKSPGGQTLAPGAVPGYENLYLRDNATGTYTPITTQKPTKIAAGQEFCVGFAGADPAWTHIFFVANGSLTSDAPQPEGVNLYEWTAAEGVKLVSIALENGKEVPSRVGAGFAGPGAESCEPANLLGRAISDDGRKVVFSTVNGFDHALYSRIEGSKTVQIDANQGGAGPSGGGVYLDASADGSKILFTAGESKLVKGAGTDELYRYDVASGRLEDLTLGLGPGEAGVAGIFGASSDLSSVYFASELLLTNQPNAEGEVAKEFEGKNIYLWREGEPLRYVGNVEYDSSGYSQVNTHDSFVSADGNTLAFTSTVPLTSYDNRVRGTASCAINQEFGSALCNEVYLYDASLNQLLCASCNPSGAPHTFDRPLSDSQTLSPELASIPLGPGFSNWLTPSRDNPLSADGHRLFFLSFDRLVPRDTNSAIDVYEFERLGTGSCEPGSEGFDPQSDGCVALISSGSGSFDSYFLDATPDGGEAQISTDQPLVGADPDESYDVYAARIGGGFPEPTSSGSCLSEGSCRPGSSLPPAAPSVGSGSPLGEGNLPKAKRPLDKCRKLRGKRRKRCELKRHRGSKKNHRKHTAKGRRQK